MIKYEKDAGYRELRLWRLEISIHHFGTGGKQRTKVRWSKKRRRFPTPWPRWVAFGLGHYHIEVFLPGMRDAVANGANPKDYQFVGATDD